MTGPRSSRTRVLLVDDDEKLNALLGEYLGRFNFAVRSVAHPNEGLHALKVDPPDIVILDVMLPDMDGFAVCRKIRATSRVPIIMLTARGDVADRIVGLELGADDYLPKPFEPRELMARMHAVLRRGASMGPEDRVQAGPLEMNWTSMSARLNGQLLSLTPAEFELLGLLVRNRGRVLSRDRIIDETRGIDWDAYDRSVDVLISRLRRSSAMIRGNRRLSAPCAELATCSSEGAMSERAWSMHVRQSVFTKLVAIMLGMAAVLLVLVLAFVLVYLGPVMSASIDGVVHEYVHTVATTAPTYQRAKEIGNRLDVQTRYEGPDGAWATDDRLPTIAEARRHERGSFSGRHYYVTSAPNGGTYLFAFRLGERMRTAHVVVPAVVLLLIATVVFAAHGVLKRVLLPVRWLADGVGRLSEGDLEVAVPTRSGDEFGALTDAFNRMVGRIKDMIRSRDQLLLDVSHELRSPVTRLKVALELVSDPDMKARMAADLAEIEIMIGELLELERLRDGRGIITTRQDVMSLIGEVARNYDDRPPSVRVVPTSPEVLADIDRDRMRVVIRNLVENAVKYSLPGSRPVEVSATHSGQNVVIRVSDDGPGIPERDMPNLFEPFFRVDRSRSKRTGGYGLGLSIAKRIVEAHGGTIAAENTDTRGASFVVTLPKPA
jgi:DNA-binding response OmpR family regulator/signal transduction histidine kinase